MGLGASHKPATVFLSTPDIEFIVAQWIPRLGLQSWDIRVLWDDPDHFKSPDNNAYIWRARDYEQAKLYVNPNTFHEWPNKMAHQIIVHELLHLVTQHVEFVIDQIEDFLHRDVDTVISEVFKHHLEGAIDKIAWRMVELAGID